MTQAAQQEPNGTGTDQVRTTGLAVPERDARVKRRTARKARTRRQRGPSVAVRGNADGAHRPSQLCTPTVLTTRTPVRYASVDSAT